MFMCFYMYETVSTTTTKYIYKFVMQIKYKKEREGKRETK